MHNVRVLVSIGIGNRMAKGQIDFKCWNMLINVLKFAFEGRISSFPHIHNYARIIVAAKAV